MQEQREYREEARIWTKSFISLSLTQLLIFTIFYTLLTTLPIYVITSLEESESKAGLVVTFMLLAAILIRPFSAKLIDILGKKQTLFYSVLLYFLTTVSYVFLPSFTWLVVIRFIHGLSFGIVTTVMGAIVANIIPASRRGEGMGYFAMSMNLAVVIGPFIGLFFLQYVSFQWLFIVLSLLMAFGLMFTFFVDTGERGKKREASFTSLRLDDLFDRKALPIALLSGLVGFSYGSILSFVPVYAESLQLEVFASYFFLLFALLMIVSRPYVGRLFDEKGSYVVLLPSLLLFALGLALLSWTKTGGMLLLSAGVLGLGYGSILPGFQTIAVQRAGFSRTSQAMSTFFTFYDVGIGLGAFIWGLVSFHYGFPVMYLISAILVVVTAFFFHLVERDSRKKS